jgi:D-inositol-3-phosphate glycosyltransferase
MASIVILGSAYPLRGGGLATFNERLARAFMAEGHQVCIYTFSLQYPKLLFPGKSQYSDEQPPQDLDIRVKVNSINPLNWFKTGNELRKMKPDILIIRYWLPFMALSLGSIAAITKKNKHTRIVAIADNIVPHEKRPGDTMLTRYFIKKPHTFICMSDTVRKDLLQFGIEGNRIRLELHPLYDNFGTAIDKQSARKHLGLPADKHLILFFGFIRDYKGLDLLIKAFAHPKIKNLPVRMMVAGEFYTNAAIYHDLANELQVADRIIWHTEFIPNDKVKAYFCAADLVVQPYKHATQSGVTQVAYHFEKPMVVTNVGGLPEMVEHKKVGYVVSPDSDAIADAIADFFINSRAKLMEDALKEAKKRFSWEKLVESILNKANL